MCNSRLVASIMSAIFVLVHIVFILDFNLENVDGSTECHKTGKVIDWKIWPWFDITMFCFIPFTLMIICDVCIIRKISTSAEKMSRYSNTPSNTLSKFRISGKRLAKNSSSTGTGNLNSVPSGSSGGSSSAGSSKKRQTNMTAMLLAISCSYLILTVPIGVYILYKPHMQNKDTKQLAWVIVIMLRYMNNVIHFFLYCCTGSKFRGELLDLFYFKCKYDTF